MTKEQKALNIVVKEVKRMDPNLKPEDETFKVAVTLMSSVAVGPNIKRLSKFTKYPRKDIARWSWYWRENKVWIGSGVCGLEWFEKDDGGIAFWADAAVGMGWLKKT